MLGCQWIRKFKSKRRCVKWFVLPYPLIKTQPIMMVPTAALLLEVRMGFSRTILPIIYMLLIIRTLNEEMIFRPTPSDGKNRDYDGAISKLEMAYMHLCDDMNDNVNNLKFEMFEIKSEIRKVPLKIMDLIKKDIKGINNSECDIVSAISESDSYKTQIYQLTEQLQHQCKDIWNVQLHCWQPLSPAVMSLTLLRHYQRPLAPLDHHHQHPALRRKAVLWVVIGPPLLQPVTPIRLTGIQIRCHHLYHRPQHPTWDTATPWGSSDSEWHWWPGRQWHSSWLACPTWPRSRHSGTNTIGQPSPRLRSWYCTPNKC